MNFTREEYFKQYSEFYDQGGIAASGSPEFNRSQAYYDLPKRGGFEDGMSLLDYGCGCGAMCGGLEVEDYYGVDIVPKAIELAKQHFPNKKFDVLEVGKLKCEPKDFCIALSVFTHCLPQDTDDCLRDIATHTTKGALIDILEGKPEKSDLHVRYWNKEEFIKKLKEFGFEYTGEFSNTSQYDYVHTYLILKKYEI